MRLLIPNLVVFFAYAISAPVGAVTFNEDFSGGIRPGLWDIVRTDPAGAPWTIAAPDSFGGLQLSKTADSDSALATCVGGIASRFQVIGDFSVNVGFNLLNFPEPNAQGWNEAALRIGFAGTPFFNDWDLFEIIRYTESQNVQKQWLEGWSSQPPPYTAFGATSDPTVQGYFCITRSGETLSAWIDRGLGPVFIGSVTSAMLTGPANVQLITVQQPGLTFSRPSTSLDVRFDNLSITAEAIVPEPSTLALLLTVTLGGLLWWRRRA